MSLSNHSLRRKLYHANVVKTRRAGPLLASFLGHSSCSQITVDITAMLHPEDSHISGLIVQVKEYPILAAVHPISVFLPFYRLYILGARIGF